MKENENENEILEIDDIDREIINLFNEDGRMSYRKIAKILNVSIGTVHNRMEKLTKRSYTEIYPGN